MAAGGLKRGSLSAISPLDGGIALRGKEQDSATGR